MSSAAGDSRRRPGLFDSLRASLTPAPLPADDGSPIVAPGGVKVATVLSIVAGTVLLFIGVLSVAQAQAQLDSFVATYEDVQNQCVTDGFGVGEAAVAPTGATPDQQAQFDQCRALVPLTPELLSSAKTQSIVVSSIVAVLGAAGAVAGWFLRTGARWARRVIIGCVAVLVLMTMFLSLQNLFLLVGTLFFIVSTMLVYIGRGGVFFARTLARRRGD